MAGLVQLDEQFGLPFKVGPVSFHFFGRFLFGQHLFDNTQPAQLHILSQIDRPKTAFAQGFENLIALVDEDAGDVDAFGQRYLGGGFPGGSGSLLGVSMGPTGSKTFGFTLDRLGNSFFGRTLGQGHNLRGIIRGQIGGENRRFILIDDNRTLPGGFVRHRYQLNTTLIAKTSRSPGDVHPTIRTITNHNQYPQRYQSLKTVKLLSSYHTLRIDSILLNLPRSRAIISGSSHTLDSGHFNQLLSNKENFVQSTIDAAGLLLKEARVRIPLPPPREVGLIIGRNHGSTIVDIDLKPYNGVEAGISRRHARLFKQDGQWFIEDLGSRNGTYINAVKIVPNNSLPIHHGDKIRCGLLVFIFLIYPLNNPG